MVNLFLDFAWRKKFGRPVGGLVSNCFEQCCISAVDEFTPSIPPVRPIFPSIVISTIQLFYCDRRGSRRRHDMTSAVPALWRHFLVLRQIDCSLLHRLLTYHQAAFALLGCYGPYCGPLLYILKLREVSVQINMIPMSSRPLPVRSGFVSCNCKCQNTDSMEQNYFRGAESSSAGHAILKRKKGMWNPKVHYRLSKTLFLATRSHSTPHTQTFKLIFPSTSTSPKPVLSLCDPWTEELMLDARALWSFVCLELTSSV